MAEGSQWFVLISGRQYGPVGLSHLEKLSSRGRLRRTDLVWTAGYDSWVSAGSIDALFPQPSSNDGALTASVVSAANEGYAGAPDKNAEGESMSDMAGSTAKKRGNYLVRHWRGELSLPVSYWINGFLGNIAAFAAITVITANANFKDDFAPLVALSSAILIWVTLFGTVLWQVTGTWRSAGRYKLAHPRRYWGGIARFALVIVVLRTIGEFAASGAPEIAELYAIHAGDDRLGQHTFRVLRDGRELEFAGGITFGSAKEFKRFLDAMRALKVIHLNSPGGRILEAQRIGELIKKRNLSTYVSGQCLSACTIIFLSGRERYMSSDARLGFHQPNFPGVTAEERRAMIADEQARLRRLGVSDAFARKANQATPDDMWFPTSSELLQEGVVTRMAQSSEFAISGIPASSTNSEQVQKILLANETYVAIKRIDPSAYATISERLENGMRRGVSVAELHEQISPVAMAVLFDVLPYAPQQSLFEFVRFTVKVAKVFNQESPASCYFYFNPAKTTSRVLLEIRNKYSALLEEEAALKTKILQSFGGKNVPIPNEYDIAASLQVVEAVLAARYGDDMAILSEDVVPPNKYSVYCSITVSMYEEALKLPSKDSYPLLRFILAN